MSSAQFILPLLDLHKETDSLCLLGYLFFVARESEQDAPDVGWRIRLLDRLYTSTLEASIYELNTSISGKLKTILCLTSRHPTLVCAPSFAEEVRDRFFNIHNQVNSLGNLTSKDSDEQFLKNADEIHQAALTTRELSYAEENIDKLYRLEHGDDAVRRTELQALRDDVVEAQVALDDADSGLYRELQNLRDRADSMMSRTQDSGFLDEYVLLLGDYRAALEQFRHQEFDDLDEDKNTDLVAPAITSPDYRVGYGYNNFVPFWALSTWHSTSSAAQSSGSGGGANTGFSSGFSGAGGSSSF